MRFGAKSISKLSLILLSLFIYNLCLGLEIGSVSIGEPEDLLPQELINRITRKLDKSFKIVDDLERADMILDFTLNPHSIGQMLNMKITSHADGVSESRKYLLQATNQDVVAGKITSDLIEIWNFHRRDFTTKRGNLLALNLAYEMNTLSMQPIKARVNSQDKFIYNGSLSILPKGIDLNLRYGFQKDEKFSESQNAILLTGSSIFKTDKTLKDYYKSFSTGMNVLGLFTDEFRLNVAFEQRVFGLKVDLINDAEYISTSRLKTTGEVEETVYEDVYGYKSVPGQGPASLAASYKNTEIRLFSKFQLSEDLYGVPYWNDYGLVDLYQNWENQPFSYPNDQRIYNAEMSQAGFTLGYMHEIMILLGSKYGLYLTATGICGLGAFQYYKVKGVGKIQDLDTFDRKYSNLNCMSYRLILQSDIKLTDFLKIRGSYDVTSSDYWGDNKENEDDSLELSANTIKEFKLGLELAF